MQKVLTTTQEECLQTRERESTDRIPLVTTFNPHTTFVAEIARRNWNFLQSKERLARIFNKPPLVSYRRPKSLRDRLVSTKFKTVDNTLVSRGCEACEKPKCSWCKRINKTTTFASSNNNKTFAIFHSVNCQSSWFTVHRQSETASNLRLNNHRNHIKRGISSCELTKHFLHNKRTHSFDNIASITITEQIRKGEI